LCVLCAFSEVYKYATGWTFCTVIHAMDLLDDAFFESVRTTWFTSNFIQTS